MPADLLVRGRVALVPTTNFDELIERADARIRPVATDAKFVTLRGELMVGPPPVPTVAHLHGILHRPTTLVALMGQIGRPLAGVRRAVLEAALDRGVIAFAGYSNGDQDIKPVSAPYPRGRQRWFRNPNRSGFQSWEFPVELGPSIPSGAPMATADRAAPRRRLERRDPPRLDTLVGTVALAAGLGLVAAWRLGAGLDRRWTAAVAATYAEALASEHRSGRASRYLATSPERGEPTRERWPPDLACYRRHIGDFRGAACGFATLRSALSAGTAGRPESSRIPDLIGATMGAVETGRLHLNPERAGRGRQQRAGWAILGVGVWRDEEDGRCLTCRRVSPGTSRRCRTRAWTARSGIGCWTS